MCRKCEPAKKLANHSQPFVDQSTPNLGRGACRGVPVYWRASFQLLISCSVANIFSVKFSKSIPKKGFCPLPVGGSKRLKNFGQNFSNSSYKWICVQVWLRSVQWPQRLGIEKKEEWREKEKTTMVKYKPFGIDMLGGLINGNSGWSWCTGSQPAGDLSHPPNDRLPLLTARHAVTFLATEHHRPLAGTHFTISEEGRRLSQLGWLVTYRNKVQPPGAEPRHGHPSLY